MPGPDEIDVSELAQAQPTNTEQVSVAGPWPVVQQVRVVALEGSNIGQNWTSSGNRFSIGSHPSNDVVLSDPAVSRFHLELRIGPTGIWLHDLDSRNGTLLDGVPMGSGAIREGSTVRCGRSVLRVHLADQLASPPISANTSCGSLVGSSVAMRSAFAMIERVAPTEATVLIEGETGTGKEGAAEAIHHCSPRKDGPFVVVDCSALLGSLLESELFGHERGAFTGASSSRLGAFAEARGGTIFLDEIGELPQDLQPKLLRVLERRQVRRLGSNRYENVDVRVVAATNRDLRAQVNEGSFRSDVYYRLAVVKLTLPALRERAEDIPLLVEHFRDRLGLDARLAEALFTPEFIAKLQRAAWPGNVRELRNFLERCAVMQQSMPLGEDASAASLDGGFNVDPHVSYSEAKQACVREFERRYLSGLMQLHQGNISRAAREAGMDRPYLYKLLQRHGLRG
jgi:two-component system, NtrC family, response regulator GlrR